jgi:hypothetical protein
VFTCKLTDLYQAEEITFNPRISESKAEHYITILLALSGKYYNLATSIVMDGSTHLIHREHSRSVGSMRPASTVLQEVACSFWVTSVKENHLS